MTEYERLLQQEAHEAEWLQRRYEPTPAAPLWLEPVVYLFAGLVLGFASGRFG